MLIRVVRLTLQPEAVQAFLTHFDAASPVIRRFPGCEHLELWQDVDAPNVFTSYSHWTNLDALERYRQSDLFKSTWAKVKPLFALRTEAFSAVRARTIKG